MCQTWCLYSALHCWFSKRGTVCAYYIMNSHPMPFTVSLQSDQYRLFNLSGSETISASSTSLNHLWHLLSVVYSFSAAHIGVGMAGAVGVIGNYSGCRKMASCRPYIWMLLQIFIELYSRRRASGWRDHGDFVVSTWRGCRSHPRNVSGTSSGGSWRLYEW